MGHPGKRAPTVELCNDPRGFQPLAIRQHYVGPYPLDPNLIAQGIPPDDRVDFNDRIHAPLQGTPLPPSAAPLGTPPDAAPPGGAPLGPPPGPAPAVQAPAAPPPPPGNSLNGQPIPAAPPGDAAGAPPADDGAAPAAAPSAFDSSASGHAAGPSVAVAHYDPKSGEYLTPDGQMQQVQNLAAGGAPKSWKDLLPI
jgi:hypothetical protein